MEGKGGRWVSSEHSDSGSPRVECPVPESPQRIPAHQHRFPPSGQREQISNQSHLRGDAPAVGVLRALELKPVTESWVAVGSSSPSRCCWCRRWAAGVMMRWQGQRDPPAKGPPTPPRPFRQHFPLQDEPKFPPSICKASPAAPAPSAPVQSDHSRTPPSFRREAARKVGGWGVRVQRCCRGCRGVH